MKKSKSNALITGKVSVKGLGGVGYVGGEMRVHKKPSYSPRLTTGKGKGSQSPTIGSSGEDKFERQHHGHSQSQQFSGLPYNLLSHPKKEKNIMPKRVSTSGNVRKDGASMEKIEKAYFSRFEGNKPSNGRGQVQGMFPRRPSDNSLPNNKKPHMNYRSPAISPEKLEALLNKPFYPGPQQTINQPLRPGALGGGVVHGGHGGSHTHAQSHHHHQQFSGPAFGFAPRSVTKKDISPRDTAYIYIIYIHYIYTLYIYI